MHLTDCPHTQHLRSYQTDERWSQYAGETLTVQGGERGVT
jgi:hypothetical protein